MASMFLVTQTHTQNLYKINSLTDFEQEETFIVETRDRTVSRLSSCFPREEEGTENIYIKKHHSR